MSNPVISDEVCVSSPCCLHLKRPSPTAADRQAYFPVEKVGGLGVTCWRRLRDWQDAGVRDRLLSTLIDRLGEAALIDWERAE